MKRCLPTGRVFGLILNSPLEPDDVSRPASKKTASLWMFWAILPMEAPMATDRRQKNRMTDCWVIMMLLFVGFLLLLGLWKKVRIFCAKV